MPRRYLVKAWGRDATKDAWEPPARLAEAVWVALALRCPFRCKTMGASCQTIAHPFWACLFVGGCRAALRHRGLSPLESPGPGMHLRCKHAGFADPQQAERPVITSQTGVSPA